MLPFTKLLHETIVRKLKSLATFIHLDKAFDSVDHNLLKKPNSFGLRGQNEHLMDYLLDRETINFFAGTQLSSLKGGH